MTSAESRARFRRQLAWIAAGIVAAAAAATALLVALQ